LRCARQARIGITTAAALSGDPASRKRCWHGSAQFQHGRNMELGVKGIRNWNFDPSRFIHFQSIRTATAAIAMWHMSQGRRGDHPMRARIMSSSAMPTKEVLDCTPQNARMLVTRRTAGIGHGGSLPDLSTGFEPSRTPPAGAAVPQPPNIIGRRSEQKQTAPFEPREYRK
jgi:hypothetical protein